MEIDILSKEIKSGKKLFAYVLCEDKYFVNICHKLFPNLNVLLKNRHKQEIFYVSSNIESLIVTHIDKFNMIPVVNSPSASMIELQLLEKYFYRVKILTKEKAVSLIDQSFGYLFKQSSRHGIENPTVGDNEHFGVGKDFSFGKETAKFGVKKGISKSEIDLEIS